MRKLLSVLVLAVAFAGCASTETFVAYQGWTSDTSYVFSWSTFAGPIRNGDDLKKVIAELEKSRGYKQVILTSVCPLQR